MVKKAIAESEGRAVVESNRNKKGRGLRVAQPGSRVQDSTERYDPDHVDT